VTIIGVGLTLLIGGVVITESVFAIPGIGRLTVDAILRRDYPIIQAVILLSSGVYVLVNLVIDLVYTCWTRGSGTDGDGSRHGRSGAAAGRDGRRRGGSDRRAPAQGAGRVRATPSDGGVRTGAHRRDRPRVGPGPHLGTVDPIRFSPAQRLRPPSDRFWFGTDSFGRDVYSRTMYGGRISLVIGFSVALLATTVGLAIGLVAGYLRTADAILMRLMDGLMAIPSILLAIAIIAITRASVRGVLLAIAIPEIPRVVRLVRGIVLTLREQPYVEATRGLGSGLPRILLRHLLPNTLAPLTVQATYICAVAILIEAALGFLGAGTPPEIPSWGNIMAEGRTNFQVGPWMILFPGAFLALVVLA
jgi:peptide/nickel transport system permease protein